MADGKERKRTILEQTLPWKANFGGKVIARNHLLPQVAQLSRMALPHSRQLRPTFSRPLKEVALRNGENQKFPLKMRTVTYKTASSSLPIPYRPVRPGNQKALSPRLNDGLFLYDQGLSTGLDVYHDKLKHIVFQKELGSLDDKANVLKPTAFSCNTI